MITPVVCGPTASGKTRLAARIARAVGGEIISADSRQVYRGMDIGTGKDLEEYGDRAREGFVPYHLIDVVEPSQIYTLYDYQRDFYKAYDDVTGRGRVPIVAGGSGLYIEAVLKGYDIPAVPENVGFRKMMMEKSREELIDMLRSEAPEAFAKTDVSTKKRIVRALEVVRFKSEVCTDDINIPNITTDIKSVYKSTIADPLILYVVWERASLRERIKARLYERLSGGMIDEVARLINTGIDRERFALFGMEYKHVAQYVYGEVGYEDMAVRLLQDIYHLAKRQDTWFRGMERRGFAVQKVPQADFDTAMGFIDGRFSKN